MALLPHQTSTNATEPVHEEDGNALIALTRRLISDGDYVAATAHASLATALFMAQAASATAPLAIHPGDHAPEVTPWCGTCRAPNRRITATGERCSQCNTDGMRARNCRYCGVYLEKRPVNGPEEPWCWTDENNTLSCPQAPDPMVPLALPVPAKDVWPPRRWASFLVDWHTAYKDKKVTAEILVQDPHLRLHLPRTTYGDYHAVHLDHWLSQRADTDCDGYSIQKADDQMANEASLWTVMRTSEAS